MTRNLHVLVVSPNNVLPRNLAKNPDLDIEKNYKKIKTNWLLTDGLCFL